MARVLRVLSCFLMVELSLQAAPDATTPTPATPKGKNPFGGGKWPDLSKLGKAGKALGKAGKAPGKGSGKAPWGNLKHVGKGKGKGKGPNNKFDKRRELAGKVGKKPPEEIAKMRERAAKLKGKQQPKAKHTGKPQAQPFTNKFGKGKQNVPDLSKMGKFATKGPGYPSSPYTGKAGKKGKPPGIPELGRVKEFLEKQFGIMDSNRDGDVTSDELTAVVAALRKRAEDSGIDLTPKDGPMKPAPWKGFEQVESSLLQKTEVNNPERNGAAGWFETADFDKNGKLTFEEFKEKMHKNNPRKLEL